MPPAVGCQHKRAHELLTTVLLQGSMYGQDMLTPAGSQPWWPYSLLRSVPSLLRSVHLQVARLLPSRPGACSCGVLHIQTAGHMDKCSSHADLLLGQLLMPSHIVLTAALAAVTGTMPMVKSCELIS